MVNTILGKIANIVEKDFLFGSFLPALLFFVAVATAVGISMGAESVLAVLENLDAGRAAWMSSAIVVGLVVLAYVLSALRGPLTRLWSGDAALARALLWGFVKWGEASQRARYNKLRRASQVQSSWLGALREFEDQVRLQWSATKPQPGCLRRWILKIRIGLLHPRLSPQAAKRRLAKIARAFEHYNGNALTEEYAAVKRDLLDWDERESFEIQSRAAALDRGFGSLATVKATRLGNVIDSYNYYAYSRFNIEAELAWPRLQQVIPDSHAQRVTDAKVLLDFAVALCTLASLYGVFALLAGPWLVYSPRLWLVVALTSWLAARFFYLLSVDAAIQYGDLIRASFDLFRLQLLKQLGFVRPPNLKAERETWRQFSQLIVYGTKIDLDIAAESNGS